LVTSLAILVSILVVVLSSLGWKPDNSLSLIVLSPLELQPGLDSEMIVK